MGRIIRIFLELSRPGRRTLAVSCLAVLLGCGEEEAPARVPAASSVATPGSPASPPAPSSAQAARDWLEISDPTPPQVWLAGRSSPPADPALLAALLKEADGLFDETPRMLANRTAQLQTMLSALAVNEPPRVLIEGFLDVGRAGGGIGYSDLCQHYYNLRASGLDRTAALGTLADAAARRSGQ